MVFPLLAVGLCAAFIASVAVGSVAVPPQSFFRLIARGLGMRFVAPPDLRDATIILQLRLPRAFSAVLVGSTLAACGAVMQGLFRNPMASPEVLGVSAGASLGAVIAIAGGISAATPLSLPMLTVIGASLASLVIYLLSSVKGSTSLFFLVIAGLAVSSLFNGVTSALLLFSRE